MENRMRDLEQIQERDQDDRGRKVGNILLATLAIVGLTFAMGVVVGRAAEPELEENRDPLDQLEPGAGLSKQETEPQPEPKVEAADLTFTDTLMAEEDRPEVIAALEAAALEEANLADASPEQAWQPPPAVAVQPTTPTPVEEPAPIRAAQERIVAAMPAAIAAGPAGRTITRRAKTDRLVAESIPQTQPGARAPHGMDGNFTLQVISYDSPEPARGFADGLRARGHEAFVVKADIPERGRFWRVRIGPFKSRGKAEKYRQRFEEEERMNTFVVRRRERQ